MHGVVTNSRVGQGGDVPKVDNEKLLHAKMLPHRTQHLRLKREKAGGDSGLGGDGKKRRAAGRLLSRR